MSQLDDLLARSRAPGRLVERRQFTLSREKAIEKQREFALRHPRQYVLELVQAAVFAGATYIAIDTRPHSLLVAWVGGDPLLGRDLEGLFDYLFADRGDARYRHLIQLAIGVNAILQRKPRTLRIESGDGETAIRMDLDARGRGTLGTPTEAIAGTYLYAEYGGGWFSRFASSSWTEEQVLVEEKCLYTPVPILLNGNAPFGYRGTRHIEIFGARLQEHFDDGKRRGVVAIHTSPQAPTGFRMVVGGVWISTLPLGPLAERPLVGVVCDDNLRKTADQSDIVQDHRYVEMLHAVQPVATQLMLKAEGSRYRPPALPPIPKVERPGRDQAPQSVEAQPLPETLRMLWPRWDTTLAALRNIGDTPIFYVEPGHTSALEGPTAQPDRFPWRVLVLTEGQVLTLSQEIPNLSLHRLTSKADVDFVRRVVDRRVRIREHTVAGTGFKLTLRLHLEGPVPDWGHGRLGVPFVVVDDEGTLELGVVDGTKARISGARAVSWETEREVRLALNLPRVSLRVEVEGAQQKLSERHVALALARAWHLAMPERGEPHRELLSALLGSLAVPQFVRTEAGVRVGASLPVGWPDGLRHVPLVATDDADLTLEGFLDLLGTPEARTVPQLEILVSLDRLEARFGYGHLTHPALEGLPLFGAGRIAGRWIWLEDRSQWSQEAITQIVWVGATFSPRRQDARWQLETQPAPELVGATRVDVDPVDWDGGWQVLFKELQRIEAEGLWGRYARRPLTVGRCEGLGRLALLHLAEALNYEEQPLLVPSDGGGRRSLREMREHQACRVVARHGVKLAEPWTFALTRDELAVIEQEGDAPPLRYDDSPDVWRSLSDAEQGWLVRNEVRQTDLRGWLGLRCPHDGTAGILLRTTGQLIALSEVDRSVPCHGLVWPDDGSSTISQEQRRVVQLAGLRLYQSLIPILRDKPDEVRTMAAQRYATTFVLLAHRRSGTLQGTAHELARLVPVLSADGQPWGTLAEWVRTSPEARPELPPELVPEDDPIAPRQLPDGPQPTTASRLLSSRLSDALGKPSIALTVREIDAGPREPAVMLDLARSHRGRAIVLLNRAHPLAAKGYATPGRPRELLLLEMARQVCVWGEPMGLDLDLTRTQMVLLAQRIDGAQVEAVAD
ncbi:MAG: hypothetical protein AAGA48_07040 [Myxococcota bacterium]